MNTIESVNISIGSNLYGRFENFANTASNVLAEFVDNALQSYRDNKEKLHAENPDYHFSVHIEFIREEFTGNLLEIRVIDNAAGISSEKYIYAFEPARKPSDDKGLNEFGMGLKTAACWLGDYWTVTTKALGEDEERVFRFDLNQVTANDLRSLPVQNIPCEKTKHYTIISIKQFTKNAPTNNNGIIKIKKDLASIYRLSLKRDEMRLVVDEELLEYKEPEILKAPYYKTPDGPVLEWRKDIVFEFDRYKAHGFIGILKEMSSTNNGFVLLRRGRVVVGAEDGQRYFPKSLCGNVGSPRYKRMFGELELEGFNVSFNKNDILDKENLDALMEALQSKIHTKDFDLYAQAEGYRLDEHQKLAKRLIKSHDTSAKQNRVPIEITTSKGQNGLPTSLFSEAEMVPERKVEEELSLSYGVTKDDYTIDGINYTLEVSLDHSNNTDLVWLDMKKENNHIIICRINLNHILFKRLGQPNDTVIAILKTIAIAKYTAKKGENSAIEMMNYFNDYIRKTKV
ncbi:MAG: hypothetical protein E7070_05295 [Bacteroidales bacterium]|nr:hypothetical protein [Bacteroidales bacterium]